MPALFFIIKVRLIPLTWDSFQLGDRMAGKGHHLLYFYLFEYYVAYYLNPERFLHLALYQFPDCHGLCLYHHLACQAFLTSCDYSYFGDSQNKLNHQYSSLLLSSLWKKFEQKWAVLPAIFL